MRIGILGGTFNPVHLGHLLLAQGALEEIPLDRVLWIPARVSPHKAVEAEVSAEDRARMVELAIEGNLSFRLSRTELSRESPSYTIETIRWLRTESNDPKVEWFFLIGSDTAGELSSWRQIEELRRLVHFVAVPRPGQPTAALPDGVRSIPVKTLDVSSSEIRRRIQQKRSIRYLVPESVRSYIEERKLYRGGAG